MASMGTFPPGTDSSMLLHSVNRHRPMIPMLVSWPKKCVKIGRLADCYSTGWSRNLIEDRFSRLSSCNGCNRRRKKSNMERVKASQEGTGGGESVDASEDTLQATIEKSEKVLAMQRDLLAQIAERKKLVSSIKNTIVDPEESKLPFVESNGTVSSFDAAVIEDANELGKGLPHDGTSSDANLRQNLKTTASGDVQSKEVPSVPWKSFVIPNPEPSSNKDSNTAEAIITDSKTSFEVDSKKKLMNATVKTAILSDVPSSTNGEDHKSSKESTPKNTDVNIQDPIDEDMKPPPLAGANVMNIILVAIECAPWSKTGFASILVKEDN